MTKDEASLPTVSLVATMLSCAIDAKEGRLVIVTNIPGAFLHADLEDNIHMLLNGTIMQLIIKLGLTIYRNTNVKTKRETYVPCQAEKIPIWYIKTALLFWKLLSRTLQEWGFKINYYDHCVTKRS